MGTSKVSKSKTFDKETEMFELMDFVDKTLECTEREIPYHLGLDVKVETNHKYIITVTKVIENDRE